MTLVDIFLTEEASLIRKKSEVKNLSSFSEHSPYSLEKIGCKPVVYNAGVYFDIVIRFRVTPPPYFNFNSIGNMTPL